MTGGSERAPSIAPWPYPRDWRGAIERRLEAERDQLPLWLPVMLGAGIAAWFGLPDLRWWRGWVAASAAIGLAAVVLDRRGRLGRAIAWGAFAACLGCGLAWMRSEHVAAPVLAHAVVAEVAGRVGAVEPLPAREAVRLTIDVQPVPTVPVRVERSRDRLAQGQQHVPRLRSGRTGGWGGMALPPRIRLNVDQDKVPPGLAPGATIAVRARLVPPPPPAVPGAYDFARVAWFQHLGATGKALEAVRVTAPAPPGGGASAWLARARADLTAHIQSRIAGSSGGVAAAFVTGDTGAIGEDDAEAMRRSGLAHLLSISGLHVAAVIAGVMFLTLRLLALSQWLALRAPLLLIAAGAGAAAGIGYTLLSGAQVPTVRSCVASLMVLGGIALGREAMTLRLVATGALVVLLVRPEALVGPSFQLSFAAVTAIVALYDHPRVRALGLKREEAWPRRIARELAMLLLTGLLVEAALAPIALYHFHRDGLYGALANIVAIPLTTFIVMPAEALALLLDIGGFGAPAWWVAARALDLLLGLARWTAALPGSVQTLPSMPTGAFLLMLGGGLWLALWRTGMRRLGAVSLAAGALWALLTPAPDLLVTGDGRHLAVRSDSGALHLLRPRAGDYVRDLLGWGAGVQADAFDLDAMPGARCSADACVATIARGGRPLHLLATRTPYQIDWDALTAACAWADIAVSDRRLPSGCTPKWLKLDAAALGQSGGVAVTGRWLVTVNGEDRHPWVQRAVPRGNGLRVRPGKRGGGRPPNSAPRA